MIEESCRLDSLLNHPDIQLHILEKVYKHNLKLNILHLGTGGFKTGLGLQSLDLAIQSLELAIQRLDLVIQSLDWCIQSLDQGDQSLDLTLYIGAEVEENLDRH